MKLTLEEEAKEFFDSSNLGISYDTEYQYCKKAVIKKAIEFVQNSKHVQAEKIKVQIEALERAKEGLPFAYQQLINVDINELEQQLKQLEDGKK